MRIAPPARPASSPVLFSSRGCTTALFLALALGGCDSATELLGASTARTGSGTLGITPVAPVLGVGQSVELQAAGERPVSWESLDQSIAAVDHRGRVTGVRAGRTRVVATVGEVADTVQVAVTGDASVVETPQWRIADENGVVEVENAVLRLRFAYAAAGRDGWFTGGESSGGGGQDGGIVEMYYKPTSNTRNLVFRNGQWGSLYDQMDLFEAEEIAADRTDHDSPDFGSGRDARMIDHRVYESAGILTAEFHFQFRAWRIRRTYLVYPWGDITVHVRVTQTESGRFNYLAHRFIFAASRARFTNGTTGQALDWGTNFQADREMMHAWSDGAPVHEYIEPIRDAVDRNTVLYESGRSDAYSGFMLDDRNGNDPDIVVMNGDSRISESPFQTVSARFGGKHYVETALFSPRWAPENLTHADMSWFYLGTPCCEVRWSDSPTWGTELGSWEESFHVMLRQGLQPEDYLPLWRSRAGSIAAEAPRGVVNASFRLDGKDRLYHLAAESGAESISWEWQRGSVATGSIDYRTAFVVEDFDAARIRIEGKNPPAVTAYRSGNTGRVLVVLSGEQPGEPQPYRITLSR